MYMKRYLLLFALLLPIAASAQVPWMKGKTPVPFQKDTTRAAKPLPPPPDTLLVSSVLYVHDTTLLPASVYLQRAAGNQTREIIFGAVGGAFLGLAFASPDQDGTPSVPLLVVGGVSAVVAIINHFGSIRNTRKAGKALSRVRLQSNGLTIDL